MKKVTLRADENLIRQARLVARSKGTTLNAAFQRWLVQFTGQEFSSLMKSLHHVRAGRHFSRDEMNER